MGVLGGKMGVELNALLAVEPSIAAMDFRRHELTSRALRDDDSEEEGEGEEAEGEADPDEGGHVEGAAAADEGGEMEDAEGAATTEAEVAGET